MPKQRKEYIGPKGGIYHIEKGQKVYTGNASAKPESKKMVMYKKPSSQYIPRPPGLTGRGDYKKSMVRSGLASTAGGVLGALAGSIFPGIGTAVGATLGSSIGGLIGLGDYQVRKNSLLGVPASGAGTLPTIQNTSGRFIFQHKEYITDIFSSSDFSNRVFDINPGLSECFPWLSTIAQNFQQWRPLGMAFAFKSLSADALNSTNTALGNVVLATDYNASSTPFVNKNQMENTYYNTSTKPSNSVLHPIECSPLENQVDVFYIRTGAVPSGQDKRLYDLGIFQMATVGMQADEANIGELWLTYEIELLKPILPNDNAIIDGAHLMLNGTIDNNNPLGSSGATVIYNTIDGFSRDSNNSLAFLNPVPNSNYLITLNYIGTTGAGCEPSTLDPGTGMSLLEGFFFETDSILPTTAQTGTSPTFSYAIGFDPIGLPTGCQLLNDGIFPSLVTKGELLIMRLPNKLTNA